MCPFHKSPSVGIPAAWHPALHCYSRGWKAASPTCSIWLAESITFAVAVGGKKAPIHDRTQMGRASQGSGMGRGGCHELGCSLALLCGDRADDVPAILSLKSHSETCTWTSKCSSKAAPVLCCGGSGWGCWAFFCLCLSQNSRV